MMNTVFSFIQSNPLVSYPLSLQIKLLPYRLGCASISSEESEFLNWLSIQLPDQRYRELQDKYLDLGSSHQLSFVSETSFHKYFDLPYWSHSKFTLARLLDIVEASHRLNILDIGAGPCHFAAICKFYGHDYLGIDRVLPRDLSGSPDLSFYADMASVLDVNVIQHYTTYEDPLPSDGFSEPFDVVVSLMSNFCVSQNSPWTGRHWSSWFSEMFRRNAISDSTHFYLMIGRKYVTTDMVNWFESRDIRFDHAKSVIRFDASSLAMS